MDMLLFQKEEIEAAELQEGEEDALLEQEKTPEQHGKADTTDGRKCNTSV